MAQPVTPSGHHHSLQAPYPLIKVRESGSSFYSFLRNTSPTDPYSSIQIGRHPLWHLFAGALSQALKGWFSSIFSLRAHFLRTYTAISPRVTPLLVRDFLAVTTTTPRRAHEAGGQGGASLTRLVPPTHLSRASPTQLTPSTHGGP